MPPRRRATVEDEATVVHTPKHFKELCEEHGQHPTTVLNEKGEAVKDAEGNPVRFTHFSCEHGVWVFDDSVDDTEE
jgi:hypothetical protein